MARTNIAVQSFPIGAYPSLPLAPGSADLMFTATDDPISRQAPLTDNRTFVLAFNSDVVAAHTVTFTSVIDQMNRAGDITNYSVAAGNIACFGPFRSGGWAQSGSLWIDVSDARLRLAVINTP